jgi:TPR repeat protein
MAADCDRLAASPGDIQRPDGLAGVESAQIDAKHAIAACKAAVAAFGDEPRFAFELARAYSANNQNAQALQWATQAANENYGAAAFMLARAYDTGDGVPKSATEANEWYEKAAQTGTPLAELFLGIRYHKGEGLPKDDGKAREWLEKAADQGSLEAQAMLGLIYYEENDFDDARMWLEQGASQGQPEAEAILGLLYLEGKGVAQDLDTARALADQSAAQGSETGKQVLKRIDSQKRTPTTANDARHERLVAACRAQCSFDCNGSAGTSAMLLNHFAGGGAMGYMAGSQQINQCRQRGQSCIQACGN